MNRSRVNRPAAGLVQRAPDVSGEESDSWKKK